VVLSFLCFVLELSFQHALHQGRLRFLIKWKLVEWNTTLGYECPCAKGLLSKTPGSTVPNPSCNFLFHSFLIGTHLLQVETVLKGGVVVRGLPLCLLQITSDELLPLVLSFATCEPYQNHFRGPLSWMHCRSTSDDFRQLSETCQYICSCWVGIGWTGIGGWNQSDQHIRASIAEQHPL
jgi:hypothetical protein